MPQQKNNNTQQQGRAITEADLMAYIGRITLHKDALEKENAELRAEVLSLKQSVEKLQKGKTKTKKEKT